MKTRTFGFGLFLSWAVLIAPASAAPAETAGGNKLEAARARLQQKLTEGNKVNEADYSIDSWNAMRFAMAGAHEIAGKKDVTAEELDRAIADVTRKITALEKKKALPDNSPRLGLGASVFATGPAGSINNVSLMWATTEPCDRVEIYRASNVAGPFEKVHAGTGASFNDYALAEGTHFYRLVAHQGQKKLTAKLARISTMPMPEGLQSWSNQTLNEKGLPGEPLKVGTMYYDFKTVREDKALKVLLRTSKEGQNWEEGPVVMDATDHPDLADCKFEAVNIFYDSVNDQIVWWCHWELSGRSYGHGRAMVATAKPGQRFKVHHIYNPLGIQVRDMSVFIDDDRQGYLVAASNVPGQGANATLYIFRLNKTLDDVVEIVAKVVEGGYREAPHIVRKGDTYYLLFSQAAGWYPSRGGYVSAGSLQGPWSAPRSIGNASTFASQSGGIIKYGQPGSPLPVMMANRWIRGEGTSRNVALPLVMSDGFAFYDFSPVLLHDPERNVIIPLHPGRLLSQDKPARVSIPGKPGHGVEKAFDGNYDTLFQSDAKKWPFAITTDLGTACSIRNVQVSWYLHKGSEAFYTYTIEGSLDGEKWSTLLDRTDTKDTTINKTYGFTSDLLTEAPPARYVRLNVQNAHLHNNPGNWYPPSVYEIRIYGEPARDAGPQK